MHSLHYSPRDGWFGDPMPVWHDGVYHVYYTKRFSDGQTGWGHLSTRDFFDYTEHPDPFPVGVPGTPFNTGCVITANGKFHAFYAGYDTDGCFVMLHAESEDGETFRYPGKICFRRPKEGYRQDDCWRDPAVFFDADAGVYRMVFCAKPPIPEGYPDCYAGAVGTAVGTDPDTWTCLPPLSLTGIATSVECPDLFRNGDRYILGYYWHETRFRSAKEIDGAWERGNRISPDHFDFMAAKRMTDGTGRHILVGWLPRRDCDCMERIWGGHMLIPRELTFPDGKTPATRFVPELDQWFSRDSGELKPRNAVLCGDGWHITEDGTGFTAPRTDGGHLFCYPSVPECCRIRMRVTLSDPNALLVLTLCAHPMYTRKEDYLDMGYDLLFDASEQMIRLREHYMWDQRNDIAVIPYHFIPGKEFDADIVLDRNILEVNIAREQTLVSRLLKAAPGGLAVSVQDSAAAIRDFRVSLPCGGSEGV